MLAARPCVRIRTVQHE